MDIESIIEKLPRVIHITGRENVQCNPISLRFAWLAHILRHVLPFVNREHDIVWISNYDDAWAPQRPASIPNSCKNRMGKVDGTQSKSLLVLDGSRAWNELSEARRQKCSALVFMGDGLTAEAFVDGDMLIHVLNENVAVVDGKRHNMRDGEFALTLLTRRTWHALNTEERLAQWHKRKQHSWLIRLM